MYLVIALLLSITKSEEPEILLFDDGIGVKKQKETRLRNPELVIDESNVSGRKKTRASVITDVVLLQRPKASFEYVISPIDNQGKPLIALEQKTCPKIKFMGKKRRKYREVPY